MDDEGKFSIAAIPRSGGSVYKHSSREQSLWVSLEVSKGATIRNRYKQVPHLTQDTNRKVTNSQLYTTNRSPDPLVKQIMIAQNRGSIYKHCCRKQSLLASWRLCLLVKKLMISQHQGWIYKHYSLKNLCGQAGVLTLLHTVANQRAHDKSAPRQCIQTL